MTKSKGATGPKPKHSREKVAQAAIALADAEGIGAVSARRIAAQLHAGASSLYRYVKSQDDLAMLMLDQASAEYDLDAISGAPFEQLLALARQGRLIMRRHPWVPALALGKQAMGPHALAYLECAVAALADSGLDAGTKLHTIAMLNAITAAFALNEQSEQQHHDPAALAGALATGAYPHLAGILGDASEPTDPDRAFEAAIGNYLRGVMVSAP